MRVLPPLPVTRRVSPGGGERAPGEGQGLGDAQPGPIQQREHGDVARLDPAFGVLVHADAGADVGRVPRGNRLGQRVRQLGAANGDQRRHLDPVHFLQMPRQAAQGRKRARQRTRADPLAPAHGQKGANVADRQRRHVIKARRRAEVVLKEGAELRRIAAIGLDGRG